MSSNAHGQRIVKATPTTTTYFVHRGGGQLLSEYQATEGDPVLVREYIYLGGRLLASLAGPANGRPEVEITSPDANDGFTAPGNITVTATASDDGSVASVKFYAGTTLLHTDTTSPYSYNWTGVTAGNYMLTAVATDDEDATTTSAEVPISVNERTNVALASNGASASASSSYTAEGNYLPANAINGDRTGANWGDGGGWNDATSADWPDWIEIAFNGSKTIDEVRVFSVQDNYQSPSEPTETMTFTYYGLTDFSVEYWTGSAWSAISGASVSNNDLVRKAFTFSPVTTTKIRVVVSSAGFFLDAGDGGRGVHGGRAAPAVDDGRILGACGASDAGRSIHLDARESRSRARLAIQRTQ